MKNRVQFVEDRQPVNRFRNAMIAIVIFYLALP